MTTDRFASEDTHDEMPLYYSQHIRIEPPLVCMAAYQDAGGRSVRCG